MRNKLIIEKDKQLIDSLKFKHSFIKDNIEKLLLEKSDIENKLIENLICPKCYSQINEIRYVYHECEVCDS